jgi:hypothetical protein
VVAVNVALVGVCTAVTATPAPVLPTAPLTVPVRPEVTICASALGRRVRLRAVTAIRISDLMKVRCMVFMQFVLVLRMKGRDNFEE